jgi:hypothetical protein
MRRPISALAAVLLALLPAALPVAAAEAACELSVTPRHGPPGTEFVFSGSGYTPTRLTLRQEGSDPKVMELDLGEADPFEIPLVAMEADAGTWTATASVPGTDCHGRATIRVTLPSTSAAAAPDETAGQLALGAGVLALVVVFLAGARLMRRRLGALV